METDLLANLLLLVLTAGGSAWMVWTHARTRRESSSDLEVYAHHRAMQVRGEVERWRRGFRVTDGPRTVAFSPDVNAGAAYRTGIVDTWRVEIRDRALTGVGPLALRRRAAPGAREPADVEGRALDRVDADASDAGLVAALAQPGALHDAVARLLQEHRVRTFDLDAEGTLQIIIERKTTSPAEVDLLLRRTGDVVNALAARPAPARSQAEPARPGAAGVGSTSGRPVPVATSVSRARAGDAGRGSGSQR